MQEKALEAGDAMQSSVLYLISSTPATPVIINWWDGESGDVPV